ncbi:hypothetical protein [Pelagibacterium xiamenense]|uniref:hypothetical protein n=1 Tax=Pelagibacterium xiamenense TaxID=2901140 RepID=UPI001E308BBD|nr:hypothetical protein [Pelagibacterium xiamenense]MCD7059270.1 hypothetical protein [Pelagibacterium xiamenense]
MMGTIRFWVAVAVVAAGATPVAGQSAEPGAYLGYNGIAHVGAGGWVRHVPFGSGEGKMREVADRLYGDPETFTNRECGAGPIDFAAYANGLALHFQDGVLVGWSANAPDMTTLDGIGV